MEFHLQVRSWGSSCSRKPPNPLTSTLRHLWLATPVGSPSAMSSRSRRTPSLQPPAHRPANARALDGRYTVSGSHAQLTAAARQLTHRCQPHQAASNKRRAHLDDIHSPSWPLPIAIAEDEWSPSKCYESAEQNASITHRLSSTPIGRSGTRLRRCQVGDPYNDD